MTQKAIQTSYAGYLFRSRLEARWAVFFDSLSLKWEYEAEGFELSDGRKYLPDFKTTTSSGYVTWYEVKPLGSQGDGKIELFQKDWLETSHGIVDNEHPFHDFILLAGDPIEVIESGKTACPRCGNLTIDKERISQDFWGEVMMNCYPCDFDTPGGGENSEEVGLLAPVIPYKGDLKLCLDDYKQYKKKIESACKSARSARFEHGQCGSTML